jgi:hypothetical protein
MIWIAEGIGKLASIDPIKNYKINEYPNGDSTVYSFSSNRFFRSLNLFLIVTSVTSAALAMSN